MLRWPLNSPTSVLLLDMLSAASFSSSFYVSLLAVAQVATADDFGTFIFVSFFFSSFKSLIGMSFCSSLMWSP